MDSGHLTPHLGGVVTGTTHLLSPASPQWAPSFQSALTTSFPHPQSPLWVSHPHSYLSDCLSRAEVTAFSSCSSAPSSAPAQPVRAELDERVGVARRAVTQRLWRAEQKLCRPFLVGCCTRPGLQACHPLLGLW